MSQKNKTKQKKTEYNILHEFIKSVGARPKWVVFLSQILRQGAEMLASIEGKVANRRVSLAPQLSHVGRGVVQGFSRRGFHPAEI